MDTNPMTYSIVHEHEHASMQPDTWNLKYPQTFPFEPYTTPVKNTKGIC